MEPPFTRTMLFMTAGVLIWAADFLFIHVFGALACARGWADATVAGFGVVPFASAMSSLIALAATAAIVLVARPLQYPAPRGQQRFRLGLAFVVAILGSIAIGITALPGLLVDGVCG